MFLQSLKIVAFRNITRAQLEFDPGVNVLVGDNAQGKTSVLEAILYLATSTSHRTTRAIDLVQQGCSTAFVGGTVQRADGDTTRIEVGFGAKAKQIKIEGTPLPRVGQLYGRLRVVLFAPEDLEIISGAPHLRRKCLDMLTAQCQPAHIDRLLEYGRALQQRNAFLRRADPFSLDETELRSWDEQLAITAVSPIKRRRTVAAVLMTLLEARYRELAGGERVSLRYVPDLGPQALEDDCDLAGLFRSVLHAQRERDITRGVTGRGPHRDDLAFTLGERPLRIHGSQGQRRTAALALRLAEAALIARETGQQAVLLIDDVMYEMDPARRSRFLEQIDQGGQAFITVTHLDALGPLARRAKVFRVVQGQVVPESR